MDSILDFSQTPLAANYSGFYAKVLNNVFTEEECKELMKLPVEWAPAGLSASGPTQTVHRDFRNSDRCLVFDSSTADKIFERLSPLVQEIHEISPTGDYSLITGKAGRKRPASCPSRERGKASLHQFGSGIR